MRRIFLLVALSLLAVVPIGTSAPIGGTWSDRVPVESKVWTAVRKFQAGERAAVLAIGDHDERGVKVHIAVYDVATKELIAEDRGDSETAGDFVGLTWYPPRDGDYRVEVRHSGSGTNKVYIAIK